jgi:hypothetical protein
MFSLKKIKNFFIELDRVSKNWKTNALSSFQKWFPELGHKKI